MLIYIFCDFEFISRDVSLLMVMRLKQSDKKEIAKKANCICSKVGADFKLIGTMDDSKTVCVNTRWCKLCELISLKKSIFQF